MRCSLVAASSLKLLPDEVKVFAQWGMLAHDGLEKTFDAAADGFVPGEGAAVIVLKRLSDAIAQGDKIRAVIRGSATNHDGRSSVLTAPNGPAQEAVMRSALKDAQVKPQDISFVETHGTGTALGDPIEVEALDAVYGLPDKLNDAAGFNGDSRPCLLGAVKTNLGHLEAAAGLAGLIKVVLSLEHELIPANLNFRTLNPEIRLASQSRLKFATASLPWARTRTLRFGAVSSFGLGGTNAHVILEEAPALPAMARPIASPSKTTEFCLPISAHTAESLLTAGTEFLASLQGPDCDLSDLVRAAARARDHREFRIAVTGTTATEIAQKLSARLRLLTTNAAGSTSEGQSSIRRRTAFIFSGQGSVWKGMLNELLSPFPEAEKVIAQCEQIVSTAAGWSLKAASEDQSQLRDTAKAQPLLFAMQMAVATLLSSWAVNPDALAGHSAGELAAAVTAGLFTIEEGMLLAIFRGRHMGAAAEGHAEPGRMLSAEMTADHGRSLLLAALNDHSRAVSIAAFNAPRSIVFSGPESSLRSFDQALQQREILTRWLDVQYAFHNPAMQVASEALENELLHDARFPVTAARPTVPLISTVTGELWQAADGDAAYWSRGIRQPVQFQKAIERLQSLGMQTYIEIGPHPTLVPSIRACVEQQAEGSGFLQIGTTLAVMRRGQSAQSTLMSAVAALYEAGCDLNWSRIYPGPPSHAKLPRYSWNRRRYWLADRVRQNRPDIPSTRRDALLGLELSSPFLKGKLWESQLSIQATPWLGDHRWKDTPILPFTAWLEIARRAAVANSDLQSAGSFAVCDLAVHRRLEIGSSSIDLQTHADVANQLSFAAKEFASLADGAWHTFATGRWERIEHIVAAEPALLDLSKWRALASRRVEPQEIYERLASNGLTYGPAFRLLNAVFVGEDWALGEITRSSSTYSCSDDNPPAPSLTETEPGSPPYLHPTLPPTLLDACLQTLQAIPAIAQSPIPLLPFSVRRYCVQGHANEVYALGRQRSSIAQEFEYDINIFDKQGKEVAVVLGLRVRPAVPASAIAPMWQIAWLPLPAPSQIASQASTSWLDRVMWLLPDVDPHAPDGQFLERVASLLEAGGGLVRRFDLQAVTNLNATQRLSVLLAGNRPSVISQLLHIVALEQVHPGIVVQICLLTRGAVDVLGGESVNPGQSALLGMLRSFRAEYPAIPLVHFDLPLEAIAAFTARNSEADADCLINHLRHTAQASRKFSGEFALRNQKVFRSQLSPWLRQQTQPSELALIIGAPGLLDSLDEQQVDDTDRAGEPAPDEVQIDCRAHGVNFRDVLTALGTYAGPAAPLGAECSGSVICAGQNAGFAAGTNVMAFAPASLRSVVNVRASYVLSKPPNMTFAEAASIPVAFLTAHYGFSRLAQLKPGDTVLIHSAAGGLGQAAVQLARLAGAEIITTAGTAEKRTYLERQGIKHVFDSRNDLFAGHVLHATGGRGVDVVLNALSGETIAASFKALRQGGSFLEVGKRDIWTSNQVGRIRPDAHYWAFDLGEVAQQDPHLVAAMLHELSEQFKADRLSPLPTQVFAMHDARSAFRFMASGQHIGKLVLQRPELPPAHEIWEAAWKIALTEGTTLISGGTGAIGLETARWLVAQGAKSLVLLSRRGADASAGKAINELKQMGALVSVERADVAERAHLIEVLSRIDASSSGPLRVIIHAAGETDDHLLAAHTSESFEHSMRAKMRGAQLFDELTQGASLMQTIYFSSVAAVLGSAAQSSYAAANAYLDGMAARRSSRGLPTLSVNWGGWAGGGMIDQLSATAQARLARQGIRPMPPSAAFAALNSALRSGGSRAIIADLDWQAFQSQFPNGSAARGFFEQFLPPQTSLVLQEIPASGHAAGAPIQATQAASIQADPLLLIRSAPRSERLSRMETWVRACARTVLGLSSGRPVPSELPLQELGLDSLMALELRNILAQSTGRPLSATLLFDYPSVHELSVYLLPFIDVETKDDFTGLEVSENPHELELQTAAAFAADLEAMSDIEAERLLLAELDGKGQLA